MLRALVELGNRLEAEGDLPPVGFYDYGQPIRWIVHVWSDPTRIDIEASEIERPRPYSGRTSGLQPHPVADEAAYALGVSLGAEGKRDERATQKHQAFLELIQEAIGSVQETALKEALEWVYSALERGTVKAHPRFDDITAKDWISFMPEEGALRGTHLFDHDELRAFWVLKTQENVAQRDKDGRLVKGECSICGQAKPLIKMIPLNAKLNKTSPLHSLNANAFVSFSTSKNTHIGLCFECADTATRAFNYLSDTHKMTHRKNLIRDKQSSDSLKNQTALFWINCKAEDADENADGIEVGDMMFDFGSMVKTFSQPLYENRPLEDNDAPVPDLAQLQELVKLPWKPKDTSLNLSDYGFYLAVLSPNVGRIAVREWIDISLDEFKGNLARYLEALSITYPFGGRVSAISVGTLFGALTPEGSRSAASNPAALRGLLRCAYQGHQPPPGILNMAVQRFRVPESHEDPWRLHALAAAMKLILSYGEKEAKNMQQLDPERESRAYLCGRLLAMIEKAQEMSQEQPGSQKADDGDEKSKGSRSMLVDRFYGGASSTPDSSFPTLMKLLNTAYLPQLRKNDNYYYWLRNMVEEVCVQLKAAGGFPGALALPEQADFALGFYCQRAAFRKSGKSDNNTKPVEQGASV